MTDPLQPDTRPFFMDLWREHRFRVDIVAKEAGISEDTVLAMLRHEAVSEEEAQKVLATLSRLYSREYRLETVRVNLDQGKFDNDRQT
jgi:hypothetical protein